MSPDGSEFVIPAQAETDVRFYPRPLQSLALAPLPTQAGVGNPAYSPDGRWLAYEDAAGDLVKAPTGGGPVERIAADAHRVSWGDNDSLLFLRSGDLWTMSATGSAVVQRTRLSAQPGTRATFPFLLPGSRAALFNIARRESRTPDEYEIALLQLDNGEVTSLGLKGSNPRYSPTGHLLFARQGNVLFAAPFDVRTHKLTGVPQPVLDSVIVRSGGAATYGFSANGTLAFVAGESNVRLVVIDPRGATTTLGVPPDSYHTPRLSPDGFRVAYDQAHGSEVDLWMYDMRTAQRTRLTKGGVNTAPEWSADGQQLIFVNYNGVRERLVRQSMGSTGTSDTIALCGAAGSGRALTYSVAPSGQFLVVGCGAIGARILQAISIGKSTGSTDPDAPRRLDVGDDAATPSISPDGRWVAYDASVGKQREVFIASLDNSAVRLQVSTAGGSMPVWSADGATVIYRADVFMSARVSFAPQLEITRRDTLRTPASIPRSTGTRNYDLDRRTGSIVTVLPVNEASAQRVIVVTNWFEQLRARMSGKAPNLE